MSDHQFKIHADTERSPLYIPREGRKPSMLTTERRKGTDAPTLRGTYLKRLAAAAKQDLARINAQRRADERREREG
jgi:hypothetical protein